jgi:hypothetical protein
MIPKDEIYALYKETGEAFEKSQIKDYAYERGLKWFYSVTATRLTTNTTAIVGFNWGAAEKCEYKPQTEPPDCSFKNLYDKKGELGSLQKIYKSLKTWLPEEEVDNAVQTNFCFFGSRFENEITAVDLELSTSLFTRLIEMIKPKRIVGLSKKLERYFVDNGLCSNVQTASVPSNKRTLYVTKGDFKISDKRIPIRFLPHPNAKFTKVAREKAWEICFSSP